MKKYKCTICGYIYDPAVDDPENGIEAGTAFEDLPDDWAVRSVALAKMSLSRLKISRVTGYIRRVHLHRRLSSWKLKAG